MLNYDISSIPAGGLKDKLVPGRAAFIYVKLARDTDGFHKPISAHLEPVAVGPGEAMIRGRIADRYFCGDHNDAFCSTIRLEYGLEKFFVPQGEGREIEKARNDGKVSVTAAVADGGRAAIKRLLLDGKPVYDEPLF